MAERSILLIDNDTSRARRVERLLGERPGETSVLRIDTLRAGLAAMVEGSHDLCVFSYRLGASEALERLAKAGGNTPIIALVQPGRRTVGLWALEHGAADFIVDGELDAEQLERAVRRSLARRELMVRIGELEERVRELDFKDENSGAWTGAWFRERLAIEVRAANRHGHALTLCVCVVDGLPTLTRTHGENTTNMVLRRFTNVTRDMLRSTDFVARYGADEFAMILPYTDRLQAQVVIERVRERFAKESFVGGDGRSFSTTATFGVAQAPPDATIGGLLERADDALDDATAGGCNQVITNGPWALGAK